MPIIGFCRETLSHGLHVAQMTLSNAECRSASLQKLGISIDESAESVLSTIRALMKADSKASGNNGNPSGQYRDLEQALVEYIDHSDSLQNVDELLDMALEFQGLSPEAACRRTRCVSMFHCKS